MIKKEKGKPWLRPCDVKTVKTADPKKIIDKYLVKHLYKVWNEDFADEDTGEIISIERRQVLVEKGFVDQDKLQEIMFHIQAGEIDEVEVCEHNVQEYELFVPEYPSVYTVELNIGGEIKVKYTLYAQTIPQAIQIAVEFGNVYRGIGDYVKAIKVNPVNADIVPDDHPCIPEAEQKAIDEHKDYYLVSVRTEWFEDMKWKNLDLGYIINASDAGQAKDRIARLLDYLTVKDEKEGVKRDKSRRTFVRKAVPFEVDCVVPRDYSMLYNEKGR